MAISAFLSAFPDGNLGLPQHLHTERAQRSDFPYIQVRSMCCRKAVSHWNHFPIFSSGTASWNIAGIKYSFKNHSSSVPLPEHRITESMSQHFNPCTQLKFIVLSTSTFCLLEDGDRDAKVTFRSLKRVWTFSLQPIRHCREAGGFLSPHLNRSCLLSKQEIKSLKQCARLKLNDLMTYSEHRCEPKPCSLSLWYLLKKQILFPSTN